MMRLSIQLVVALSALLDVTTSQARTDDSRRLRRAVQEAVPVSKEDASSIPSRSLFEDFAAFFYESMDEINKKNEDEEESPEYVPFREKLDMLSNSVTFSTKLTTSRGDSKASFYYLEWHMTGSELGCGLVAKPHVKLQCTNNGRIHVDHPCIVQGVDTAVCMHGYPEVFDYTSEFMGVWCSGTQDEELGLTVRLAAGDATCESASGEVAHGVSLGQACGAFRSEAFKIIVEESFCQDPAQYLSAETVDDNPRCWEIAEASNDNLLVSLPIVAASASPSKSGGSSCIYRVDV